MYQLSKKCRGQEFGREKEKTVLHGKGWSQEREGSK